MINWIPESLKPLPIGKISAMGSRAGLGITSIPPKTAYGYYGLMWSRSKSMGGLRGGTTRRTYKFPVVPSVGSTWSATTEPFEHQQQQRAPFFSSSHI